ncbi:MAG: hypothetical protein K1W09_03630 [Akkermansia muciniphila]|uniref:hypothetical protein n=1 Tax=uncultured Akkermansia sp. TaxID=512294 RepID=UPI002625C37A|nr:hypothetical protein [uncultured Akkermansia sp.]
MLVVLKILIPEKILTNTFSCLDGKIQGTNLATTPGIPFFQHAFPNYSLIRISTPLCVFPYQVIFTGLLRGRGISTVQHPNGDGNHIVIYFSEAIIGDNMAIPGGGFRDDCPRRESVVRTNTNNSSEPDSSNQFRQSQTEPCRRWIKN